MRGFATRFRDLADHFESEPNTDTGTKLRTEILTHLSEDAGPAPADLKMESRQVIGMERPAGDGEIISDVYLVMH